MKRQHQTVYQHEPLLTPSAWQGEDRRFAIRLAQMMEQLFLEQRKLVQRVKTLEEEKNAQV